MNTWITVYLDGDYHKHKYENIFAAYIIPIVDELGGTNAKCVTYQDMTEAEFKFATPSTAKAAKRALTMMFRKLPSFLLAGKATVTVMPKEYEKNGYRGIVRPDYHTEGSFIAPPIKSFAKLKLAKKYTERTSPPLPANDYCGQRMKSTDDRIYVSVKQTNGVCRWVKFEK